MPTGDAWLHEFKYDGWRLLARKDRASVRLFTRGGHDWTARLPVLAAAVARLPVDRAWLDGELVVLDDAGRSDFEALPRVLRAAGQPGLFYHTWDAPWCGRASCADEPLLARKARLAELLAGASARLRYTGHVIGQGATVFAHADALDLEGVVAKRVTGRYHAGERTGEWLKVKVWRPHRAVVGGAAWDVDGRLEALLVGTPLPDGRLHYEGRVAFGLQRLRGHGAALRGRIPQSPFVAGPTRGRLTWVAPTLPVALRALPRRPGRHLRHAVLVAVGAE